MLLNLKSSVQIAALLVALVTPAVAQVFVGSDNFNTGADTEWDAYYRLNSATQGTLSFTNSRLDFSTTTSGVGNYFLIWDSDGTTSTSPVASSFTTSWVMQVTATNLLSSGALPGSSFATVGIQVYNGGSEYYALMLGASNSGFNVRSEDDSQAFNSVSTGDSSDVVLRMSWNASTQILATSYSLDGTTFNSVSNFNPISDWASATTSNGFNFGLFGNSNLTSGNIVSGSVYADNFSISAVPEPSTYAAIAGLGALGLAFWRKRRKAA